MKCFICKTNEGTIRLIRDNKTEYICKSCADLNYNYAGAEIIPNILKGLFAGFEIDEPEEIVCEACGTTHSDFLDTGLLGCAQCYTAFKDVVEPLVSKIHSSPYHVGKSPEKHRSERATLSEELEYKQLLGELERAIDENRLDDAKYIKALLMKFNR
jgi:protein arginine kinase activator